MGRKTLTFNGFGFPILLVNVSMKTEHGEELPDVSYKAMEQLLFEAVIRKPARLCGAEVKFLRHHFEMTQFAFAKLLKIERSLVSKWESKDLKATGMTVHAEIFLRLKLAKLANNTTANDFEVIELGAGTKGVGKPLAIDLKAS